MLNIVYLRETISYIINIFVGRLFYSMSSSFIFFPFIEKSSENRRTAVVRLIAETNIIEKTDRRISGPGIRIPQAAIQILDRAEITFNYSTFSSER
jgi:hypothetical protein